MPGAGPRAPLGLWSAWATCYVLGMATTTAAAHIVTSDAVAMCDPKIIIMTRADETGAAEVIERIDFDGTAEMSAVQTMLRLVHGWRVGNGTLVEPGYFIFDVEKV